MTEISQEGASFRAHSTPHSFISTTRACSHVGEPPGWTVPQTQLVSLALQCCSWSPLRPVPGTPLPQVPLHPRADQACSQAVPAAHQRLGMSTRRVPRSLPCHPGKHSDSSLCVFLKKETLSEAGHWLKAEIRPWLSGADTKGLVAWQQPSSSSNKKGLAGAGTCWMGARSQSLVSLGHSFLFRACARDLAV